MICYNIKDFKIWSFQQDLWNSEGSTSRLTEKYYCSWTIHLQHYIPEGLVTGTIRVKRKLVVPTVVQRNKRCCTCSVPVVVIFVDEVVLPSLLVVYFFKLRFNLQICSISFLFFYLLYTNEPRYKEATCSFFSYRVHLLTKIWFPKEASGLCWN